MGRAEMHDGAVSARRPSLAQLLGTRIVALRIEAGLTQEKLGWDIGLTAKGHLSRIESGQRLPSMELLERIATRLGVEVRDLLIFPERGDVDQAMEKVRIEAGPKRVKARSSRG